MKTKEIWKTIPDFPKYKVSNFGNIKSCKFDMNLKPQITNGYARVSLYRDKKQYPRSVHRLVAESFIAKKHTEKNTVDHIDGNKLNNNVENLQYLTRSENVLKYYNGDYNTRGRGKQIKMSGRKAIKIMYPDYSQRELAFMFGVSQSAIRRILNEVNNAKL